MRQTDRQKTPPSSFVLSLSSCNTIVYQDILVGSGQTETTKQLKHPGGNVSRTYRENGAGKFEPTISNGFPRVAISVMSGMAGRPDAAYANISNWFLDKSAANDGYGGGSMSVNLGPNTMYQEAGGAPCNESPLGAAFAIQSWLLSSWSYGGPESALKTDVIRAFPSIPTTWRSSSSVRNTITPLFLVGIIVLW